MNIMRKLNIELINLRTLCPADNLKLEQVLEKQPTECCFTVSVSSHSRSEDQSIAALAWKWVGEPDWKHWMALDSNLETNKTVAIGCDFYFTYR